MVGKKINGVKIRKVYNFFSAVVFLIPCECPLRCHSCLIFTRLESDEQHLNEERAFGRKMYRNIS
jgi:hypothetical protein